MLGAAAKMGLTLINAEALPETAALDQVWWAVLGSNQ
jgi:hypothetical protein